MANEKVNTDRQVAFLDLPLEDLMVPYIAKHMKIEDIFAFRCCSRFCKQLGDSALATTVTQISLMDEYKAQMGFSVIAQNCRRLMKIDLAYLDWLTDEMLIEIFMNNPLLEFVWISPETSIPTLKALYSLATNCKKLTFLFLNGPFDATFLKLLNLSDIQLVQTRLWDSEGVSDEAFAAFFEKQPRLQHISLTGGAMSARIFAVIGQVCKDLRCLEIEGYQYKADDMDRWESLIDNCPKLKDVCLSLDEEMGEDYDDAYYLDFLNFLIFLSGKNLIIHPLDSTCERTGIIED